MRANHRTNAVGVATNRAFLSDARPGAADGDGAPLGVPHPICFQRVYRLWDDRRRWEQGCSI